MQIEHGVAWDVEDGLGRIELRRPDRANSLETVAAHALARAIHSVLDAKPKVVLLSAEGNIFCAGGDIQEFERAGDRFDDLVDAILEPLHPAIARLATNDAPVISVVNGALGGAGVGVALCADIVLASTQMKLRTGYAALGLSPDLGSSCFLARRVGTQRAKRWLLLSDAIDAQTCLQAGAVDALHPPAQLVEQAEALAQRLLRGARGSHAAIKRLCDGALDRNLSEHLALEHALLRDQTRTADALEGVGAFLARRPPQFQA